MYDRDGIIQINLNSVYNLGAKIYIQTVDFSCAVKFNNNFQSPITQAFTVKDGAEPVKACDEQGA